MFSLSQTSNTIVRFHTNITLKSTIKDVISLNLDKRLTPEEALEKVKKEYKGHLKIFLGYAPGVGKTYSMLSEANRRFNKKENILVGFVETHGRLETQYQIQNLPVLPRKKINYNGKLLEEFDLEAAISLKPDTILVDELPHTNIPGSINKKRYEDVETLLDAGINVVTTLNIQHLESLNDIVEKITGVKIRETVPDRLIENAAEVEVIDISPDALRARLKQGDIYKRDVALRALKNFFRKGNLNALRELTLRQTAEEVDEELEKYKKQHGIKETWHTCERIMVCISSNPACKRLIRRGARRAKTYKCQWMVVNVDCTHFLAPKPSSKDIKSLNENIILAKDLGAETITLKGKSVSNELVNFASSRYVTQIIIGHPNRSKIQTIIRGSTVYKLLKEVKEAEIHIIPQ